MPQIHIARLGRAQLRIAEAGADAALITSPANVRYLTGLVSSNAALLLPADGLAVLGADARRELAVLLERAMIDCGAEAVAFPTIVASGPNGAIPHHAPGERNFTAGDLIIIDCGARYGGYHADMTRTVALGEPANWQREIYEVVAAAHLAGVRAATAGADVGDVDATARDVIEAAGHGGHFQQALGHGVGLQVHEAPIIAYDRAGALANRASITIEPGIHVPGVGGAGIEDTLVVRTGPGSAQMLTTTTRELLVL